MARRKPAAPRRMSSDELLELVVDALIAHVVTAPDGGKATAAAEVVAVAHVAESALHGVFCRGPDSCPRREADAIAGGMLSDLHGALSRVLGTTGYVQ